MYWLFSFITLLVLYRPLVYNLLDHKFGRRLSMILVPFYLLILVPTNFYRQNFNYSDTQMNSSASIANHKNYED